VCAKRSSLRIAEYKIREEEGLTECWKTILSRRECLREVRLTGPSKKEYTYLREARLTRLSKEYLREARITSVSKKEYVRQDRLTGLSEKEYLREARVTSVSKKEYVRQDRLTGLSEKENHRDTRLKGMSNN
jgi:hypothetical protein